MSGKAAMMAAHTDQLLAAARDARREGWGRAEVLASTVADFAGWIGEEFGPDARLAGRVLASASGIVSGIVGGLAGDGADMTSVPEMIADLMLLAGEELAREEASRG